ncbi:MAG: SDR family NAD(P)-dependent oxidoreductase [Chitinivibrionales bacterium]|nr:SDR family NAD(P)-dependent oxidoreductase [Chitinivibrionales bacterium]MBD3395435.1 SDR family NAD(P)-dependent oxidoreductase [Chitinivibrionales bacterium]
MIAGKQNILSDKENMELHKKVIIVTGAGSGIGRATAKHLADLGARVAATDVDEPGGRETLEIIRESGGEARFTRVDVRMAAEVKGMVADTVAAYGGRIDALVNAAGVLRDAFVADLLEQDWDLTLDVNLKGTFLCCREVLPVLKTCGGGTIVNVSSSGAFHCPMQYPAYTASKAGLDGFTRSLAKQVRPAGIAVVGIRPAYVNTPMGRRAFEEQEGRAPEGDDFKRMLKPEDIALSIAALIGPSAIHMSGSIIDTSPLAG